MTIWDQIRIEELHLRTIIGINSDERHDRQDVLINLILYLDTRTAGKDDDINTAPVNYRSLTKRVIALVEESQFRLIEALAAAVAELCLMEADLKGVRVSIDKPGALRFARSVGITIERMKTDA